MNRLPLALALLATLSPPLATAQGPSPDPRTLSPDYETSYSVFGKVVDADGNAAYRVPVKLEVLGSDGSAVVKPVHVEATCFGEFDAWWNLYNLTSRYAVKVSVAGQSKSAAVDTVHRRNDFTFALDRTVPAPAEDDPCAGAWTFSHSKATITGQVLATTPPYLGPADNRLTARPLEGVRVRLRLMEPDGNVSGPQHPIFTNAEGTYKYSFVTDGPIRGSVVRVIFEDQPGVWTNVTVDRPAHWYVVSRPPAENVPARSPDTPGPGLVAAVAAALVAALVLSRRRSGP